MMMVNYGLSRSLELSTDLNLVLAGRVRAITFCNLKLQKSGGVPNKFDDFVVAAFGDVSAVNGDHMVAGSKHCSSCRTFGHDVAENARTLTGQREPEPRMTANELDRPHSVARSLFRSSRWSAIRQNRNRTQARISGHSF